MRTGRPLWSVSVETTPEAEDAVGQMLAALFACPACSYFDFEARISRVSVYFCGKIRPDARRSVGEGLNRIRDCNIQIGPAKIRVHRLRKQDWAESWKRHFTPLEFGNWLLVKPGWSKRKPRPNQALVVLDPGLSFGTGQHPTTAFCLSQLAKHSPRRHVAPMPAPRDADPGAPARCARPLQTNTPAFLDIGTGSGILAIAAAKLGYSPVCALDFDADAVRAARANARQNHVRIRIIRRDATRLPERPKKRFHFICANLISGLLVSERERIMAQLHRGGILVLAGILKREFSEVRRSYEGLGLKLVSTRLEKEWQSGSFCFR
ncbi:MAG: 50S ribosomal protein L11 methyltransferase [Limisphaerales bacterium]